MLKPRIVIVAVLMECVMAGVMIHFGMSVYMFMLVSVHWFAGPHQRLCPLIQQPAAY